VIAKIQELLRYQPGPGETTSRTDKLVSSSLSSPPPTATGTSANSIGSIPMA
jgi:hypothetical protein